MVWIMSTGCVSDLGPNRIRGVNANASKLVLVEGVPGSFHPEEEDAQTMRIGRHRFFDGRISMAQSDESKLVQILHAEDSFTPWEEEKLCGGFHPDWAIEETKEGNKTFYLVCFGCHEVIVKSDGSYGLNRRFDMTKDAYEELQKILNPYHVKSSPGASRLGG